METSSAILNGEGAARSQPAGEKLSALTIAALQAEMASPDVDSPRSAHNPDTPDDYSQAAKPGLMYSGVIISVAKDHGYIRFEHERYRFTRANLFFVGKQLDAKSVADLSQILHPGEAVEFIATDRRAPRARTYDADRAFVYPNRNEPENAPAPGTLTRLQSMSSTTYHTLTPVNSMSAIEASAAAAVAAGTRSAALPPRPPESSSASAHVSSTATIDDSNFILRRNTQDLEKEIGRQLFGTKDDSNDSSTERVVPKVSAFAQGMSTISEAAHQGHPQNTVPAVQAGMPPGSMAGLTRRLSSRGSLSLLDGWDKGFVFKVEPHVVKVRRYSEDATISIPLAPLGRTPDQFHVGEEVRIRLDTNRLGQPAGVDGVTWSSAVLDVIQVPSGTVKQETKIKGRKQGWIIKLATQEPPRPGFIRLDNNVVECSYYVEEAPQDDPTFQPGSRVEFNMVWNCKTGKRKAVDIVLLEGVKSGERYYGKISVMRPQFGFIQAPGRNLSIFFHVSDVDGIDPATLKVGDEVAFEMSYFNRNKRECAVKVHRAPPGSSEIDLLTEDVFEGEVAIRMQLSKNFGSATPGYIEHVLDGQKTRILYDQQSLADPGHNPVVGERVVFKIQVNPVEADTAMSKVTSPAVATSVGRKAVEVAMLPCRGTVVTVKPNFGFIRYIHQDSSLDIFFHVSEVKTEAPLAVGDEVEFIRMLNVKTREPNAIRIYLVNTRGDDATTSVQLAHVAHHGKDSTFLERYPAPGDDHHAKPKFAASARYTPAPRHEPDPPTAGLGATYPPPARAMPRKFLKGTKTTQRYAKGPDGSGGFAMGRGKAPLYTLLTRMSSNLDPWAKEFVPGSAAAATKAVLGAGASREE